MNPHPAAPPNANDRLSGAMSAPGRARPALWRMPLLAFLATGVVCLKYLDGRLGSDYRRSAADLAVQSAALIESAVAHHAASVHELRLLIADARRPAEQRSRFDVFAGAFAESNPAVVRVYRLDERGGVVDASPRDTSANGLASENHLVMAETAEAITRARQSESPAASGVIVLHRDTLGFIIYDPVTVQGRLQGYVGAAVAYAPLLRSLLTPRVQGRFGYRVTDSAGRVLAVSPHYPARIAEFATAQVLLPGSGSWRLDVPVGVFQPRAARVVLWIVGVVLLVIVFLLVLREDARAERIAMHSFNLELLSRDLLDANVRLEDRAQQVADANTAKSRFLANVSHELRTPLNAIVGYNALALSGLYGEISAELRAAHERIRTAAEHLLRVVNDVLDLSKIEVGRMEVDLHAVSIEPLLEEVVSMVEPVAEAKDVRIDFVVARDLPQVVTDPRHVRQIVLNLATNAIKFTERGWVTIVAKCSDSKPGRISIAVEDTGIGIAAADLDRIFEEFEQVRPGGRGDSIVRGTGLGLAISRKLARLLGGDIGVESQVGAGSRFTLTLPIAPSDPSQESPSEKSRRAPMVAAGASAVGTVGTDEEGGSSEVPRP